ncbi:MAG: hypothetical protein QM784_33430 [Polyangiaceae bacterium]
MTALIESKAASRIHRGVSRRPLTFALFGVACIAGCSLQDFDYLKKESSAKGGRGGKSSGGAAGDTAQAGGGADAGASSGGNGEGGTSTITTGTCETGLTRCDGALECINLTIGKAAGATYQDCGACGVTCNLTNASAASCASSKCKPTCANGFSDCNAATANDGCETDTSSTPTACGACGRTCSPNGAKSRVCMASSCKPTCLPRFLDCRQHTGLGNDDGCEVHLDALTYCGSSCTDGVACSPNQVCNAGACGAPRGVVALSVPLAEANTAQRFADKFEALPDLTNATLTLRLYAPDATGGDLKLYVGDEDFTGGGGSFVALNTLATKWTDVVVPIGGAAGAFDPVAISQLNIEVTAGTTGPWKNPTVIYVDRIWSSNGLVNDTFDTTKGGFVSSSLMVVAGSTLTWMGAMP